MNSRPKFLPPANEMDCEVAPDPDRVIHPCPEAMALAAEIFKTAILACASVAAFALLVLDPQRSSWWPW